MSANNYKIVVGGTTYNLSDLIKTTGIFGDFYNFINFPVSPGPNCNFQRLANNINYRNANTDLSNLCSAKSHSGNTSFNFNIPAGITKISGIFAGGGGGGGGGGGTANADLSNNNDSGGGGGGGGAGAISVVKNFPVTEGSNFNVNVGAGGNGGPATVLNNGQNGATGGSTELRIGPMGSSTLLLRVPGGIGGRGGDFGAANNVGTGGAGGGGGSTFTFSGNIQPYLTNYSGLSLGGAAGASANKGTPGVGGNGGSTFLNINNEISNEGVYVTYYSPAGNGSNTINNPNPNSVGGNGGDAPGSTSDSFSGGGGGGAGSGQGRTNATSAGGKGANGFGIVYLYF
jgi:hypothetical protein